MIVVSPSDSSHILDIIPRYNPTNNVSLVLKNEDTKVSTSEELTWVDGGGFITLQSFTKTFIEGQRFSVKLTDSVDTDNVIWRGKLFATVQITQKYRIHE